MFSWFKREPVIDRTLSPDSTTRLLLLVALLSVLSGLLSMCHPAHASDYVYLGAWSQHNDQQPHHTRSHDFLGYQSGEYLGGTFRNSYGKRTAVLARRFELVQSGPIEVSALVGGTYGYSRCPAGNGTDRRVCPYVAVGFVYTKHRLQPALITSGTVTYLTFRWRL